MQQFDPIKYPNLVKLDEKVKKLLLSDRVKAWDTTRTEYEICKIHPIYFLEQYGWIRPGEVQLGSLQEVAGGEPVPFRLNPVQLQIANKVCAHFLGDRFSRVQMIALKHRKGGVSTLFAGFCYWMMRFYGLNAFVIADLSGHTDNIMAMIRLFQQRDECGAGSAGPSHRPFGVTPMPKNKKGMKLKNGAMVEQDSGENANPGTSGTVNFLLMSEFSKWRESSMGDAETSLLNSIPRRGFAFIIKESTAFGHNKYAQDCDDAEKGKSPWEFVFATWLDMPDCEDEMYPGESLDLTTEEKELQSTYSQMKPGHIKFRRRQIELLGSAERFRQDFPLNPREPFLITGSNYFSTQLVQDRINEVSFFRDWRELGIEKIKDRYPDLIVRMKHHPRGMQAALIRLEDNCVVPVMVELYLNVMTDSPQVKQAGSSRDGLVSYVKNPVARMEDGAALMFRPPVTGHKYLVFVDVAEGKKSSEYESDDSMIEVIDCFRREQVLEWGGLFDEEITADYAVRIAKIYNNALLAHEANNKCGGLLWGYLEKSRYVNLYYRETVSGNTRRREPGWDTKVGLKRDVCGQLKLDFKNGDCLIHSIKTLQQMLHFVDKQGKLGAAEGHKDDAVMAMSVGLKIVSITPALREKKEDQVMMEDEMGSYVRPRIKDYDAIRKYM